MVHRLLELFYCGCFSLQMQKGLSLLLKQSKWLRLHCNVCQLESGWKLVNTDNTISDMLLEVVHADVLVPGLISVVVPICKLRCLLSPPLTDSQTEVCSGNDV
jgi:hypothetical protein